ncbi:hypothetical protein JW756_05630 [Candidatus Woesearchaeota archaeon]|nr:hypothetical protein [Candidatus Woesearchaeota archaeon]
MIILFIIINILLILDLMNFVSALPPLPTEFYGVIRSYNYNGSAGQTIHAYDSDGTLCGSFTIVNEGYYGILTCNGDDPETSTDEGAITGENITFRYLGGYTTLAGDDSWDAGEFHYVNITYPVVYCGDNFCDSWYENAISCPSDCPTYNGTINITFNQTNISGGGGGGTGTGEGGEAEEEPDSGGDMLGVMPQTYDNFTSNMTGQQGLGFECQENWVCSNWTKCGMDGFQSRNCTDKNSCETFENKPPEVQKCIYTPTCFDGAKNGLEEGIDCGGLCKPCISCSDGIQNCHEGECEEDVDCGGPCPPCPTCFDGFQNCHDGSCEEGVDCNGPCEKRCPTIQLPGLVFVCKKDFNPLSNQSIIFFIIIILLIAIDMVYSSYRIKETRKNKSLSDIKRAKKVLSIKRRRYLFIFITLLLAILLYLYYYFFIMCEVEYKFLWLLLVLLFLSPLIIHLIIRRLEYTEHKRLSKLEAMLNNHYKQINSLIRIENEHISELEEELADELYLLLEKPEYKEKESSDEIKLFKELYKELVSLYSKYKEKDSPFEDEKILCNEIYELVENEKYKEIISSDMNFSNMVTKLKILYKQYEEKQKLYDEINKIEESKEELKHELKEGEK